MRFALLLLLLLAGCARGPLSYDSSISPVEHRAVRALVGATVTWGGEAFGFRPTVALLAATVGVTGASKLWLAVRHPERIGPWSAGDALCDLTWSAAVVPVEVWRWHGWRWGLVSAVAWGGAAWVVQRRCVP